MGRHLSGSDQKSRSGRRRRRQEQRRHKGSRVFGVPSDAEFTQDDLRRAETGQGRLDQVDPDKGGQQEPPDIDLGGQDEADQDHGPGQNANRSFDAQGK